MPARALRLTAIGYLRKSKKMLAMSEPDETDALAALAAVGADDRAGKITERVAVRVLRHYVEGAYALMVRASESVVSAFIDDTRFALTCGRKKRGLRLVRLPNREYPGHFIVMRAWTGNASPEAEKRGSFDVCRPTLNASTLELTLEVRDFGTVHINMPRTSEGDLDIDGDVTATTTPLPSRT